MRVAVHESRGSGPAIMMVHGNSSSSVAFRRQLEGPLGERFRVVAFDLPGHGGSDWADNPALTYTLPQFARVLASVARELQAEDSVFVGWSLGGHVLLEAESLLPKGRGFCIFGAPPAHSPPNFAEVFLPHPATRFFFQETLSDSEIEEWLAATFDCTPVPSEFSAEARRSDPRMRGAIGASIVSAHYRDEAEIVKRMSQPLAVLHGERDAFVDLGYIESRSMPTLWRGAVQVIPGAGHAPQWTAPNAFDQLVESFAESVR